MGESLGERGAGGCSRRRVQRWQGFAGVESDCCVETGRKRAGGGADASSSCDERIARRKGCENCGAPLKKACAKGPRRLSARFRLPA